jgi:hypothetical protein
MLIACLFWFFKFLQLVFRTLLWVASRLLSCMWKFLLVCKEKACGRSQRRKSQAKQARRLFFRDALELLMGNILRGNTYLLLRAWDNKLVFFCFWFFLLFLSFFAGFVNLVATFELYDMNATTFLSTQSSPTTSLSGR